VSDRTFLDECAGASFVLGTSIARYPVRLAAFFVEEMPRERRRRASERELEDLLMRACTHAMVYAVKEVRERMSEQ
jgi:hypothetical protein